MPGSPASLASSWKTMCAKMIHATSNSRGPSVAISQSSTATGTEVVGRARCRCASRPTPARVGGGDVCGPVLLQPGQRAFDQR